MSGIGCVSSASLQSMSSVSGSSSAKELMSVVENGMEQQTELATKFIRISAEEQLQQQKMSMLGQVVDMYA